MIYRSRPMQLAHSTTFEWLPASHKWEFMAMTIPGAEAHIIVQSQDDIHVIIDYFTDRFRWRSMPRLNFVQVHIRDGHGLMTGSLLTTRKPNRIICPIRDYDYDLESPMNPNSNSEIQVTLLPSHKGNQQLIWWRSRLRSNEFWRQEIAASRRSGPTYKSKSADSLSTGKHTEKSTEMSTSTNIPLKPPIKSVHPWSRPDGHRSGLRTTITDSSSISEVMPPTDGNWQRIIPWSTAQRLRRAHVHLNLSSITILEKLKY